MQKKLSSEDRQKLAEVQPAEAPSPDLFGVVAAINNELAIFRSTGNVIAAWAALGLCLKYEIQIPRAIAELFVEIAEELSSVSGVDTKTARKRVADIVLRTNKPGGGRGVFAFYNKIVRDRELVERVNELAAERPGATMTEIYEIVAAETKGELKMETVKEKFEADEREHVPAFRVSAFRSAREAALKQGGAVEVGHFEDKPF